MELYFSDNFFNAGQTEILNEAGEAVGRLDLRSLFGSALDIYGAGGELLYTGRFQMMLRRWKVLNGNNEEVGVLRPRFTILTKKFSYDAGVRGEYEIESPNFSKDYVITRDGSVAAEFSRTSGWIRSGAYRLQNYSELPDYELIAVVMGVNAIRKRQRSASSS
ncbi:hypothetical protein [Saccharibacillus sp. JS10]|uniref:hypothetical protein n=1 Tax=Saccharibacillus sp. JS10 TaxID=2950552 RepID=UPI00210D876E|nr:hypothetical protein [Saccharibacillus sp. JS10]MCQ4086466.1 hypothetical protein [Saccharibacillus sp. JS10]